VRLVYISVSLVVLVCTLLSVLYLDYPLASWIETHIRSQGVFRLYTSNLPSHLFVFVVIVSSLSLAGYLWLTLQAKKNKHRLFFLVTALVLPCAYLTKTLLKLTFARIETRLWLSHPTIQAPHWFNFDHMGFDSFPSGHMLVFTTLFLSFWHFYPQYRWLYMFSWLGLAVALLLTNYHFLSDIIAGAWVGCLVYYAIHSILTNRRFNNGVLKTG